MLRLATTITCMLMPLMAMADALTVTQVIPAGTILAEQDLPHFVDHEDQRLRPNGVRAPQRLSDHLLLVIGGDDDREAAPRERIDGGNCGCGAQRAKTHGERS